MPVRNLLPIPPIITRGFKACLRAGFYLRRIIVGERDANREGAAKLLDVEKNMNNQSGLQCGESTPLPCENRSETNSARVLKNTVHKWQHLATSSATHNHFPLRPGRPCDPRGEIRDAKLG